MCKTYICARHFVSSEGRILDKHTWTYTTETFPGDGHIMCVYVLCWFALNRDSLLLEAGFITVLVAPFNLIFWRKYVQYPCTGSLLPYSTYYKPMGDLPYISSEQGGGLIICSWLIYELLYVSVVYLYKTLRRGWAYNTQLAYNIINVDGVCESVCLSVTDVTSLPQRILWERCYKVNYNAYAGNESPNCWSGRHGHLYRAIATVTGGLRRRDRRH